MRVPLPTIPWRLGRRGGIEVGRVGKIPQARRCYCGNMKFSNSNFAYALCLQLPPRRHPPTRLPSSTRPATPKAGASRPAGCKVLGLLAVCPDVLARALAPAPRRMPLKQQTTHFTLPRSWQGPSTPPSGAPAP